PQVENTRLHVLGPNCEFDASVAVAQYLREVARARIDIHLKTEGAVQVALRFHSARKHAIVEFLNVDMEIDLHVLFRGFIAQPELCRTPGDIDGDRTDVGTAVGEGRLQGAASELILARQDLLYLDLQVCVLTPQHLRTQ